MTHQQIKWASEHDWFVCSNRDGTIDVCETLVYQDETVTNEQFTWTGTFAELRDWAGY